jgi:RNA-directed DNA polymerase
MGRAQLSVSYEDIISLDNLLEAWREFVRGKCGKRDVQEFQARLMDNIFALHNDLKNKTYKHGPYQAFNINDPKPRNIHKATVRDRLLHHAIYRILYPLFDRAFIADSYSCRKGKGTHKAINCFRSFAYRVSANHTRTCWVLKCDIRKFFASIDHAVLMRVLRTRISGHDIADLLDRVITSFNASTPGVGLPLGNLTSQLLVNIYMNEFDQYMKHTLKTKYYIRYSDDFVILSKSKSWLESILPYMVGFLGERLRLEMHPDKVFIKPFASGVDFLGWVHFPDHRVLRTSTKKKMIRRCRLGSADNGVAASYAGMLSHGNAHRLLRAHVYKK